MPKKSKRSRGSGKRKTSGYQSAPTKVPKNRRFATNADGTMHIDEAMGEFQGMVKATKVAMEKKTAEAAEKTPQQKKNDAVAVAAKRFQLRSKRPPKKEEESGDSDSDGEDDDTSEVEDGEVVIPTLLHYLQTIKDTVPKCTESTTPEIAVATLNEFLQGSGEKICNVTGLLTWEKPEKKPYFEHPQEFRMYQDKSGPVVMEHRTTGEYFILEDNELETYYDHLMAHNWFQPPDFMKEDPNSRRKCNEYLKAKHLDIVQKYLADGEVRKKLEADLGADFLNTRITVPGIVCDDETRGLLEASGMTVASHLFPPTKNSDKDRFHTQAIQLSRDINNQIASLEKNRQSYVICILLSKTAPRSIAYYMAHPWYLLHDLDSTDVARTSIKHNLKRASAMPISVIPRGTSIKFFKGAKMGEWFGSVEDRMPDPYDLFHEVRNGGKGSHSKTYRSMVDLVYAANKQAYSIPSSPLETILGAQKSDTKTSEGNEVVTLNHYKEFYDKFFASAGEWLTQFTTAFSEATYAEINRDSGDTEKFKERFDRIFEEVRANGDQDDDEDLDKKPAAKTDPSTEDGSGMDIEPPEKPVAASKSDMDEEKAGSDAEDSTEDQSSQSRDREDDSSFNSTEE